MGLNRVHERFRSNEITEEEMFESCLKVINHAIFKSRGEMGEDYFQEASISTLYCIRRYRGSERYSLSTMIYRKIHWDLIKHSWCDRLIAKPFYLYTDNIDREHITVLKNETKQGEENRHIELSKFIEPIEDSVIDMRQAISSIKSNKHRDMLKLYVKGYSMSEIGDRYNLSFKRVSQILGEARYELYNSRHLSKKPLSLNKNEINLVKNNLNISSYELSVVLGKDVMDIYKAKRFYARGERR